MHRRFFLVLLVYDYKVENQKAERGEKNKASSQLLNYLDDIIIKAFFLKGTMIRNKIHL